MLSKYTLALAAGASSASATIYQGFNYGAGTDFATEFALAKSLVGTSGAFTSARLYTTIEQNTATNPSSAIPAAIQQDVSLLLGIWGSGGQATVDNEITALKNAIAQYGSEFTSRVVGISVGSEDLYRESPTGIEAMAGIGANPADIVNYINQVRSAIAGTGLSSVPVGHVDTWTAWVNGSNSAVVGASDFLGMDGMCLCSNLALKP
jgi:glucan endo-1,3-beta-D-glucosidase